MASDTLRKKWGTIFMGDKEATMEQLDAMQEPALREKIQRDQEKEYLERVKKRACDRAREILAEAYNERQKLLAEAQAEAQTMHERLIQDGEVLKAEALKIKAEAQAELERAKKVVQDAEQIKSSAHEEGYQAGMEQAGQELKEFRADLGTEMAQVLRAIANQLSNITNHWREDLALLMRQAVSSGTGWVLDNNHETILKSLVFQAVNLLEEREVVTLRVNPEDEAIVSDLFRAAREKAPELKQWIVNGDDSIERGGLVAESGSGSVDLKRQNYRNLVADILEHLSLPVLDEEKRAEQKIKQQAEVAARRFEGVLPPKEVEPKVVKEEEPLTQVVPKVQEEPEPKIEPELNTEPKPEPELEPLEDERKPTPTKSETEKEKPILKVEKKLPPEMPEDMGMELPEDVFETESEPAAEAPEARDDNSLQALEEELFPVGQDEESQVLANGGFLPERES